ncbi:hypothetical protein ACFQZE_11375 [Paenibacillus sp. GCM10027627]|uniref:hypothetical protein n=1 Tax=unclassified Paenibacillus TaxID=185978 RepID=UPI003633A664
MKSSSCIFIIFTCIILSACSVQHSKTPDEIVKGWYQYFIVDGNFAEAVELLSSESYESKGYSKQEVIDGLEKLEQPFVKPIIKDVQVTKQTNEKSTVTYTVEAPIVGENTESIDLVKEKGEWKIIAPDHWFAPK